MKKVCKPRILSELAIPHYETQAGLDNHPARVHPYPAMIDLVLGALVLAAIAAIGLFLFAALVDAIIR